MDITPTRMTLRYGTLVGLLLEVLAKEMTVVCRFSDTMPTHSLLMTGIVRTILSQSAKNLSKSFYNSIVMLCTKR